MKRFLFLECDSTLCAIEGVDELAALLDSETQKKVISLTNDAMDGKLPNEDVFASRLELIKPSRKMCEEVAQQYIAQISPGIEMALNELSSEGWTPQIISGGFTPVIEPVAEHLGIETIHAVDLFFDSQGNYVGFDKLAPTARNGGKPEIIEQLKKQENPELTIMIGDGVSDLETSTVVDLFIGYGGVVSRDKVKNNAPVYLEDFANLTSIIKTHLSTQR